MMAEFEMSEIEAAFNALAACLEEVARQNGDLCDAACSARNEFVRAVAGKGIPADDKALVSFLTARLTPKELKPTDIDQLKNYVLTGRFAHRSGAPVSLGSDARARLKAKGE